MRPFRDRADAGRQLAEASELAEFRGTDAVVVGIPRGGVLVAAALAEALGLRCDVVVSHKLGAPGNPELAIGAVAEEGVLLVDPSLAGAVHVTPAYLSQELHRQQGEIGRRAASLRDGRAFPDVAGRTVILVDDGIATGLTVRAALRAVQRLGPSRTVVAAPVAAPEALSELREEADEVICLTVPEAFFAVGLWYDDFPQVSDEDVAEALQRAHRPGERAA